MAKLKEINRRIRSVKNTQQITRAMKMVATVGLRRAQRDLLQARPYTNSLIELLQRVNDAANISEHALLETRSGGKEMFVVIAADKGLCGSFNAHVTRYAEDLMSQQDNEAALFTIGNKARDYFRFRKVKIDREYVDVGDNITFAQAEEIANMLTECYLSGEVDKVHLVFARFQSALSRDMKVFQLLPVTTPKAEGEGLNTEYIFDPSPERVLEKLLPRYITMTVFRALLESKASEQGARMAAMDAATNNAEEMIKRLTVIRNRARQAAITTEITEIVGGADALK